MYTLQIISSISYPITDTVAVAVCVGIVIIIVIVVVTGQGGVCWFGPQIGGQVNAEILECGDEQLMLVLGRGSGGL